MIDSWDERENVVYVWTEQRRCLGYAWRRDDGTWGAKLTGSKRITFGPYTRTGAKLKLARLVTGGEGA